MSKLNSHNLSEVDQIILNARLRDEIEPYIDESLLVINTTDWPTATENEFLASMLAWERAPILPISQWFNPELRLEDPTTLSDQQLNEKLHQLAGRLYEKNIILVGTEHLTDRELYRLIGSDILTAQEKQITDVYSPIRWQCYDEVNDADVWLTYYASDDERTAWEWETGRIAPPKQELPYPRQLPCRQI